MKKELKELWRQARGTNVEIALHKLNPVIRGWANYFRVAVASEIFSKLDNWMYYKAVRKTSRMHANTSKKWRQHTSWGQLQPDRKDYWVFGDKQTGRHLLKFKWFPIERHTLIRGKASPDDPTLREYWNERLAKQARDLTISKQKIASRQKGRCLECFESLFNGEEIQIHHRIPRSAFW